MSGERFDPGPHLRATQRNGRTINRLDVHWRVVWLRQEHPDARLMTEHVRITDEEAVFRAVISIEGRGSASGHGVARRQEFADYIERAETRAIGRALLALGFGTEHAEDFMLDDEPTTPSVSPQLPPGVTVGPGGSTVLPPRVAAALARAVPIQEEAPAAEASDPLGSAEPEAPSEPARRPEPLTRPRQTPAPINRPSGPPRERPADHEARPAAPPDEEPNQAVCLGRGVRPGPRAAGDTAEISAPEQTTSHPSPRLAPRPDRERSVRESAPAPLPSANRRATPSGSEPEPTPEGSDADDEAADHDWTAFWRWARRQGYNNRDEIQQAIGRPITGRTPKELRTLIMNLGE